MEEMSKEIVKIFTDKLIIIAIGTSIWNWITNSDSGILIANITGMLILLLVIRAVVHALIKDYNKIFRKVKAENEDKELSDIRELRDLIEQQ